MSLPPGDRAVPHEPLVGALLRVPWEAARDRLLDSLHAAGFTDLSLSHLAILLYPGPQGLRPSELAAQRQMSRKQLNGAVSLTN